MTPHFGTDRFSGRILSKYVKYNTFVTFYTVLTFFFILFTGQSAELAHMLNGSNDVFLCKEMPFRG